MKGNIIPDVFQFFEPSDYNVRVPRIVVTLHYCCQNTCCYHPDVLCTFNIAKQCIVIRYFVILCFYITPSLVHWVWIHVYCGVTKNLDTQGPALLVVQDGQTKLLLLYLLRILCESGIKYLHV